MPSITIEQFGGLNTTSPPTKMHVDTDVQLSENFEIFPDADDIGQLAVPTLRSSLLNQSVIDLTSGTGFSILRAGFDAANGYQSLNSVMNFWGIIAGPASFTLKLLELGMDGAKRAICAGGDWGISNTIYANSVVNYRTPTNGFPKKAVILNDITQIQTQNVLVYQSMGLGADNKSLCTVTGVGTHVLTQTVGASFLNRIAPFGMINIQGTLGDDGQGNWIVASLIDANNLITVSVLPNSAGMSASYYNSILVQFGAPGGDAYNCIHLEVFKQRLWLTCKKKASGLSDIGDVGNVVYFTDVGDPNIGTTPTSVPAQYFAFWDGLIGDLVGSQGFNGRLIVFAQNQIWVIYPTSDITQSVQFPIDEHVGCMSSSLLCKTPYGIVFGDQYGQVRITDGNSVSDEILSQKVRSQIVIDTYTKIFYHEDQLVICTHSTRNYARNLSANFDTVWIYRFSIKEWVKFTGENFADAFLSLVWPYWNGTQYNAGTPERLYLNGLKVYESARQNTTPTVQGREQSRDLSLDGDWNTEKTISEVTLDFMNCQNGVHIVCTPYYDGVAGTAADDYVCGNYTMQTAIWRFDAQSKFRRVSFLISFTANANSNMAILGNLKVTFDITADKPTGGTSPSLGEVAVH